MLKVAGEILDRMAELKSFWNDISKSDLDRETYNHEFVELQRELKMLKTKSSMEFLCLPPASPIITHSRSSLPMTDLGEHIEMSRTGLFENFKSKFGADGVLNTGSHGGISSIIGDFTNDGGLLDTVPGFTSRDYSAPEK